MRRTIVSAAAIGLALALAACDTQTAPSAPPTSEDALTTSAPEATTEVEDATATTAPDAQTTDAAPTTSEASTEEVTTETADAGPPEMPEEATEFTEAGAEAFVAWYLLLLNHAYKVGGTTGLAELSTDNCSSCENLIAGVEDGGTGDDYLVAEEVRGVVFPDGSARVEADVVQLTGSGAGRGGVTFNLLSADDPQRWVVDSITLRSAP